MARETITTGNHVGLISSLPKWAANEIHRLDREIRAREALLAEIHFDAESNEIHVPANVRIKSKRQRRVSDLYCHFLPSGQLEVSVMSMQIVPQAANRVIITAEDGWNR